MLVLAATAGNSPGPVVGWILGHFLARFRDRRWFPVDTRSFEQATAWYARYGVWTLLFAWIPVVGDPLTVVAGAMRIGIRWFVTLVTLGKAVRYAASPGPSRCGPMSAAPLLTCPRPIYHVLKR